MHIPVMMHYPVMDGIICVLFSLIVITFVCKRVASGRKGCSRIRCPNSTRVLGIIVNKLYLRGGALLGGLMLPESESSIGTVLPQAVEG